VPLDFSSLLLKNIPGASPETACELRGKSQGGGNSSEHCTIQKNGIYCSVGSVDASRLLFAL